MLSKLIPSLHVNNVYDVDLRLLQSRGIKGLIFDLDNTLVPWGSSEISPELRGFIAIAKSMGFGICILSNNFKERSRRIAKELGVLAIGSAMKPSKRGFKRAAVLMGLPVTHVAVVGDQLFTDILGGNRIGAFTILVKPLWNRELGYTKLVRHLERYVLNRLDRSGRLVRNQ